jgi:hypothetical protein
VSLGQRPRRIGHQVEHEAGHSQVERSLAEGQSLGSGPRQRDARAEPLRMDQEAGRRVDAGEPPRRAPRGDRPGENARAAADVEPIEPGRGGEATSRLQRPT